MRIAALKAFRALLLVTALCTPPALAQESAPRPPKPPAEWTVLVFMNGDNNLEPYALSDFMEMASIGSTKDVNIVVQLDRIGTYTPIFNRWMDARRFVISKGMKSRANNAREALGEVNMGSPDVLADFIQWGKSTFPAKHYALIIWDHGQGYRALRPNEDKADKELAHRDFFRSATGMPFRSISHDETSNDQLYNAELQQALRSALGGKKLDFIGFDACLMAMVETAYVMHEFAEVMVASEDLEPGDGWAYEKWLATLTRQPHISASELARTIVKTYSETYGSPSSSLHDATTTLSALQLKEVGSLARSISTLSDLMVLSLDSEVGAIEAARVASPAFARDYPSEGDELFHHVDLKKFLLEYRTRTKNEKIRTSIDELLSLHQKVIIESYAGSIRQKEGASGLAIYFPSGRTAYSTDRFAERGYEKNNEVYPVAFVRQEKWADFLHAYFGKVP